MTNYLNENQLNIDKYGAISTNPNEIIKNMDIIIPDKILGIDVTKIDNYCFNNNKNLSSVILPQTVVEIGKWAFNNCSNINNIYLNTNIRNIDIGAFANCSNLKKIIIPNEIKSVNDYVFQNCNKLSYINLPKSLEYISPNAFYCDDKNFRYNNLIIAYSGNDKNLIKLFSEFNKNQLVNIRAFSTEEIDNYINNLYDESFSKDLSFIKSESQMNYLIFQIKNLLMDANDIDEKIKIAFILENIENQKTPILQNIFDNNIEKWIR